MCVELTKRACYQLNSRYSDTIREYPHLKEVEMDDKNQKKQLPIHLISGVSDYTKIKSDCKRRKGILIEPVDEFTNLGWTLISAGAVINTTVMFFAKSSLLGYEKLCGIDVLELGLLELKAREDNSDGSVYSEFKEQLKQTEQGYYQTGLPWKADALELPDNKQRSIVKLDKLVQRLDG